MPKVYSLKDFYIRKGTIVKTLMDSDDNYLVVANEKFGDRSFVVVRPDFMRFIFEQLGMNKDAGFMRDITAQIRQKITDKYRKMRGIGKKKSL